MATDINKVQHSTVQYEKNEIYLGPLDKTSCIQILDYLSNQTLGTTSLLSKNIYRLSQDICTKRLIQEFRKIFNFNPLDDYKSAYAFKMYENALKEKCQNAFLHLQNNNNNTQKSFSVKGPLYTIQIHPFQESLICYGQEEAACFGSVRDMNGEVLFKLTYDDTLSEKLSFDSFYCNETYIIGLKKNCRTKFEQLHIMLWNAKNGKSVKFKAFNAENATWDEDNQLLILSYPGRLELFKLTNLDKPQFILPINTDDMPFLKEVFYERNHNCYFGYAYGNFHIINASGEIVSKIYRKIPEANQIPEFLLNFTTHMFYLPEKSEVVILERESTNIKVHISVWDIKTGAQKNSFILDRVESITAIHLDKTTGKILIAVNRLDKEKPITPVCMLCKFDTVEGIKDEYLIPSETTLFKKCRARRYEKVTQIHCLPNPDHILAVYASNTALLWDLGQKKKIELLKGVSISEIYNTRALIDYKNSSFIFIRKSIKRNEIITIPFAPAVV